jgi:hypothetical protein
VGATQTRNLIYADIHQIAIGLGEVAFSLFLKAFGVSIPGSKIKP